MITLGSNFDILETWCGSMCGLRVEWKLELKMEKQLFTKGTS